MREIKFRGRTYENEWVYGSFIDAGSKKFIWNRYPIEVDPKSVGQFLCSKDMRDREIYEGDIVKIHHPDGELIGIVKFGDGEFYIDCPPQDHLFSNCILSFSTTDTRDVEVIGNIYEHKHLLEVRR